METSPVTLSGQRIGYRRVSTPEQSLERQLEGVPLDRVFSEYASARDTDRPRLQELIAYARDGDTVFVHSIDRLARNLSDLLRLVKLFVAKGVRLRFVTEALEFDGSGSATSMLILGVMGAAAEFERAILRERQREGIAIAQREGKYRGRQNALSAARAVELRERCAKPGAVKAAIAREFGISNRTLYNYLTPAGT